MHTIIQKRKKLTIQLLENRKNIEKLRDDKSNKWSKLQDIKTQIQNIETEQRTLIANIEAAAQEKQAQEDKLVIVKKEMGDAEVQKGEIEYKVAEKTNQINNVTIQIIYGVTLLVAPEKNREGEMGN